MPIHVWVKHRLTDVPAVGKKVKNLKEGDRVAMEPGATCRRYAVPFLTSLLPDTTALQLCPDLVFAATPPYDGTLTRYYRLPGDLTYKLPDNPTSLSRTAR